MSFKPLFFFFFFFFNDTATTEIYTLSLHDALPIYPGRVAAGPAAADVARRGHGVAAVPLRSEEHTSELQSLRHLVCRLLLEKKKKNKTHSPHTFMHPQNYSQSMSRHQHV